MSFRDHLRSCIGLRLALCVLGGSTLGLMAACETTPLTQTRTAPSGIGIGGSGATTVPTAPDKMPVADGDGCKNDDDCENGHCNHEICCASGNCCLTEADCPTSDGSAAVCDDAKTCQGSRGMIMCSKFRCRTKNGVKDDSACDAKTEASDCGLYVSVFCDGKLDQQAPDCPTACVDDTLCDPDAHCEDGECMRDVPDGGECSFDSACASSHCNNGMCCKAGDCCRMDTDCDEAQYGTAGSCDDTAHCQGHRGVPHCDANQCGTVQGG